MTIFKLPDLGEGLPDAEIVEWHVKVGDEVELDQSLVSMETAKAVVEVPSPFSGRIKKLYGNPGDIIKTGEALVELEAETTEATVTVSHTASHIASNTASNTASHTASNTATAVATSSENAATVAGRLPVGTTVLTESPMGIATQIRSANGANIKATPAVRAFAQRLKVNLSEITPTGPNGTLTIQDVEQASKAQVSKTQASTEKASTLLGEDYEPLKGVRRSMAHAMSQSHAEVVPVTVVEDAILYRWKEKQDITVRIIQAINEALKIEPSLNAWFDTKTLSRRFMKEVHLGMAIDTPDGLFVPVIHQADSLDANTLRKTIDRLKQQTIDRSIKPEELRGATISLSNFGRFAGRYANPIVVPPMVAILGVGRLRDKVVAIEGQAKVCSVLPLALTFDHRAVTGGEASRFLAAVIEALERE